LCQADFVRSEEGRTPPSARRPDPRRPSRAKPDPDPFERLRQNPPRQARSRETFLRILAATDSLLEEGGLDAATIPAIAERAGVSVGVIYRRFPDKDNLLRAAYQRFFERAEEMNLAALNSLGVMKLPLNRLMRALVRGAFEGNRRKRELLRALLQYARTHRDPNFRRAAMEMNRKTMRAVSVVLTAMHDQIAHPDPERAVEFVMVTIGAILHATIIEEEPLFAFRDPDAVEEETTRMIFAYLGIRE